MDDWYFFEFEDDEQDNDSGHIGIEDRGQIGESAMNDWLQSIGISYVYVNQSQETFANLFSGNVKRPDFLVLFESLGLIAVDVKNYTLSQGGYSLNLESELKRVIAFERLFRIPVWYAYMGEEVNGTQAWYWISALKALEVGSIRVNKTTKEQFVFINLNEFEEISDNHDLAKLYTHRLKTTNNLAND